MVHLYIHFSVNNYCNNKNYLQFILTIQIIYNNYFGMVLYFSELMDELTDEFINEIINEFMDELKDD